MNVFSRKRAPVQNESQNVAPATTTPPPMPEQSAAMPGQTAQMPEQLPSPSMTQYPKTLNLMETPSRLEKVLNVNERDESFSCPHSNKLVKECDFVECCVLYGMFGYCYTCFGLRSIVNKLNDLENQPPQWNPYECSCSCLGHLCIPLTGFPEFYVVNDCCLIQRLTGANWFCALFCQPCLLSGVRATLDKELAEKKNNRKEGVIQPLMAQQSSGQPPQHPLASVVEEKP